MMTQQQQDDAAARQLREKGWSPTRIWAQDDAVAEHIEAQALIARGEVPVAVDWCEEHARYFKWDRKGCTPDNTPTSEQIRAHYARR